MWEIGVWEQGDTLYETLRSRLPPGLAALERGSHPALLAGRRLDLLVAGEDAAGWAGCEVVRCGTALLPGQAETLCRALPCEQLILYGTGRACAVTLSSLGRSGRRWPSSGSCCGWTASRRTGRSWCSPTTGPLPPSSWPWRGRGCYWALPEGE